MCGRFTNRYTWRQLYELYMLSPGFPPQSNFRPRYNIAPTQTAAVVRLREGARELTFPRWGLVPFWSKDTKGASKMINAQSETAAKKPAFRAAFGARRCLVVADGFYEWPEKDKPRFITLKDNAPFAFAGLWETWRDKASSADAAPVETFTILTTTPNSFMADVHHRMPVILAPAAWPSWLGEASADNEALQALCQPFPSEQMTSWPVDRAVGNVKNDRPELVEPLAA